MALAEVFSVTETVPDNYRAVDGLSSAASALDQDALWQRIEAYVAHRWPVRDVDFEALGPGLFISPIAETVIEGIKIWDGSGWVDYTPRPAPRGVFLSDGVFQITGKAGSATPPPSVYEAFRRYAEYLAAEDVGTPGASSYSINIGQTSESFSRHPAHIARALVNSGAADLLRPYRRA